VADRVEISLSSLPLCPDCQAAAYKLRFVPVVEPDGARVLTTFAWRCPTGHQFATAMPDIPLPTWRRVVEDLESAELPEHPPIRSSCRRLDVPTLLAGLAGGQRCRALFWLHPSPVPLASNLHRCADILCFVRQRRPADMLKHPQRLARADRDRLAQRLHG
jgi:hypothetical protein